MHRRFRPTSVRDHRGPLWRCSRIIIVCLLARHMGRFITQSIGTAEPSKRENEICLNDVGNRPLAKFMPVLGQERLGPLQSNLKCRACRCQRRDAAQ